MLILHFIPLKVKGFSACGRGAWNQMVSKVSSNPNNFVFLCVKIAKWEVLQCCWEKWAVTHSAAHAVSCGTCRQTLARALVLQQEQPLYLGFASQPPFSLLWKEPASALQGAVAFSSADFSCGCSCQWRNCWQIENVWAMSNELLLQNAHKRSCWCVCTSLHLVLMSGSYDFIFISICNRAAKESTDCCPFKQQQLRLSLCHKRLSRLCHLWRQPGCLSSLV